MILGRKQKSQDKVINEFSHIAEVILKIPPFSGTAYLSRSLYINGQRVDGMFEEFGYGIIYDCNKCKILREENIKRYLETGNLWDTE